jgi:hypothetical protein
VVCCQHCCQGVICEARRGEGGRQLVYARCEALQQPRRGGAAAGGGAAGADAAAMDEDTEAGLSGAAQVRRRAQNKSDERLRMAQPQGAFQQLCMPHVPVACSPAGPPSMPMHATLSSSAMAHAHAV